MSIPDGISGASGAKTNSAISQAGSTAEDRRPGLREVAKQLESMFLQQLFQAMRESAPEGSTATERTSNEFFGGMMDEHMANEASASASTPLGKALYRQLVGLTNPRSISAPVTDTGEGSQ